MQDSTLRDILTDAKEVVRKLDQLAKERGIHDTNHTWSSFGCFDGSEPCSKAPVDSQLAHERLVELSTIKPNIALNAESAAELRTMAVELLQRRAAAKLRKDPPPLSSAELDALQEYAAESRESHVYPDAPVMSAAGVAGLQKLLEWMSRVERKIIRDGSDLDWRAAEREAEMLLKQTRDAQHAPPEATDIHIMRVNRVITAMDRIAAALKLRKEG